MIIDSAWRLEGEVIRPARVHHLVREVKGEPASPA
jgi:hypothetical protein